MIIKQELFEVREKAIVCDEGNNPPSEMEKGILNIDVRIKIGAKLGYYAFRLPIDLRTLQDGKLTHVPVKGLGDLEENEKRK